MTYRAPRHTQVTQIGDRIEIHTDPRRASAILQVLSGGTLQEVGDQLGVTRERIRQYLKDVGLTVAMRQRQVDHTERVARFQRGSRRRNRTHQKQRQRERLHRAAAWIQGFAAEEGRPPTLRGIGPRHGGEADDCPLGGLVWCDGHGW